MKNKFKQTLIALKEAIAIKEELLDYKAKYVSDTVDLLKKAADKINFAEIPEPEIDKNGYKIYTVQLPKGAKRSKSENYDYEYMTIRTKSKKYFEFKFYTNKAHTKGLPNNIFAPSKHGLRSLILDIWPDPYGDELKLTVYNKIGEYLYDIWPDKKDFDQRIFINKMVKKLKKYIDFF